jgi:S1-C subfamily serine protease
MKIYKVVLIVLIAALIALAVQVFFGNFISARLATLPFVKNLNLYNPRAPIVVTNKETVRVSDANDAVETTNSVKSKIALVVYYDGKGVDARVVPSGGAISWTADGYFVTTSAALAVANKTYAVILSNGDIFPITSVYHDTASALVILGTDAKGQPTVEPIDGKDLRPAEKMLLVVNAPAPNQTTFLESYVRSAVNSVPGQIFSSDKAQRSVSLQSVGPLTPGQAVFNLNGRLVGLWDGTTVLGSDSIRIFANNFFRDNLKVIRPGFGFTYKHLSVSEARAVQLAAGAQVVDITASSPAAAGGLLKHDIITSVNDQKITDDVLLESLLAQLTPGTVVTFGVTRNGEAIIVQVTPKILQ